MGGPGSGYFHANKRTLVEQCTGISVHQIAPTLRGWPLQLSCNVDGRPITLNVRFAPTRSVFGKGRQWWFLCPHCRRRCGWLYLPPRAEEFACQVCWGLAYRSQLRNYPPSQKRLRQALEQWREKDLGGSPLRPHPGADGVRLASRTDDPARRA